MSTTQTQTVTWTTASGREAEVEIIHQTERTINADGHRITVPACELVITARVEGLGTVGYGQPEHIDHPQVVARIGKLGIPAGPAAAIAAAIAAVEATPEWQAREACHEANRRAVDKYEQSTAQVRRAMDTE